MQLVLSITKPENESNRTLLQRIHRGSRQILSVCSPKTPFNAAKDKRKRRRRKTQAYSKRSNGSLGHPTVYTTEKATDAPDL